MPFGRSGKLGKLGRKGKAQAKQKAKAGRTAQAQAPAKRTSSAQAEPRSSAKRKSSAKPKAPKTPGEALATSTQRLAVVNMARPSGTFAGFSWHSCDQKVREDAAAILEEAQANQYKPGRISHRGPKFSGLLPLDDGFYMPWNVPAAMACGYMFFSRKIGHLVGEMGQTSNWRVVGHPAGFDPANVEAPSGRCPLRSSGSDTTVAPMSSPGPAPSTGALGSSGLGSPCLPSCFLPARERPVAPTASCACPALLLNQRKQELVRRRGAYKFGALLGKGTFGECFRARRGEDAEEVAIKVFRPSPDQHRWAWAEAMVLDRCRDSPFFPRLLDVLEHESRLSLVMEFGGQTLTAYLKQPPEVLKPFDIWAVCEDVALALQFLHGMGLLHADVKPDNILVTTKGDLAAKLADVGMVTEVVNPIPAPSTVVCRLPRPCRRRHSRCSRRRRCRPRRGRGRRRGRCRSRRCGRCQDHCFIELGRIPRWTPAGPAICLQDCSIFESSGTFRLGIDLNFLATYNFRRAALII